MSLRSPTPRTRRVLFASGALLLALVLALPWYATPLIGARLRAMAADRGYDVHWDALRFRSHLVRSAVGERIELLADGTLKRGDIVEALERVFRQ